ncbi:hypothetical protein FGO68_gene245 [Halteria grandinella]|uniref:Uncharacterized protein n=1 Tax=Halteria grandinella TaxID=5974 RepID=A0A8J8T355_HALGN|nr:hypothetical protein FGO68_gene245 [Halteria grandinella]
MKQLPSNTPDSTIQKLRAEELIESTNAIQCNIIASSYKNVHSAAAYAKQLREPILVHDLSQIVNRDANILNICHNKFQNKNKELQIWTPNNTLIQEHQSKKTEFDAIRKYSDDSKFNQYKALSQANNPILEMQNLIISRQLRDGNLLRSTQIENYSSLCN